MAEPPIPSLDPLPLPLFEEVGDLQEACSWLREVYVAIPLDQARALQEWCQRQDRPPRWSDVVRALVGALLRAEVRLGSPRQDLERALLAALAQRGSASPAD